jgi:peptide/nickel transport system substrate-binding protein
MKKMLVVLLALLMLLTACGPAATPTAAPVATTVATTAPVSAATEAPTAVPPTATPAPKTLTVGYGTEMWPTRGFTIDTDDAMALAEFGVLETLVKVDFDGKMVPGLAESWSQTNDTTWVFKLRQGVTFSNGAPFNAAAVVNSLNYIKNSPTPPRGITAKTFTSIEATDDQTITITTAALDALLPNRLTSPNTGILAPSAYTAASGPVNYMNTGTGPFILTKVVPDQSITLVKNPTYWGGKVNLDQVTVLEIPDPQVRAGMLQTGEIDIDIHVPVEQLPILGADSSVAILKMQTARTTTLDLNMSRPPFNDVLVRQAVAYAIDKQAIVDATLEGVASPAVGPISPAEAYINSGLAGYPYNVDKAKALLAQAGIKAGQLNISIWTYPDRSNLPLTAIAVQGMLAKIGINAEIRIGPYDALSKDVLAGKYDMWIMSRNHLLDNYDPSGFFASDFSCTGSMNMNHFCDTAFDAALAQAITLTDVNARTAIYQQLQKTIDDQAVGVYLNYTEIIDGASNKVLNFKVHPLERYVLTPDLDKAP